MDPCGTDARDPGGDSLHARPVEAGATHRGGVQGVHSGLPVHSGQSGLTHTECGLERENFHVVHTMRVHTRFLCM